MNSNKNTIMVGIDINIRRTDGRIHSVIISSIDYNLNIVTVEWFEKGEAKGKEVDLIEVFQLNPHLSSTNFNCDIEILMEDQKTEVIKETLPNNITVNKSNGLSINPNPKKTDQSSDLDSNKECKNLDNYRIKNETSFSDINLFSKLRMEKGASSELKSLSKRPQSRSQRRLTCAEEIEKIQIKRDERRALNKLAKLNDFDYTNPNFVYYNTVMDYRNSNQIKKCAYVRENCLQKILVCVRKRPLNKKEITKKDIDVITVSNGDSVIVHEPKVKVDMTKYMEHQNFRFDYVFDEDCDNKFVYEYTAKPLVESIFQGGMATCFAYGQTGSGKTYTMSGEFISSRNSDASVEGIYILAAKDVFEIKSEKCLNELSIEISFFEIYGGKVYDLLNRKQKLSILEDGKNQIQLIGLKSEPVYNIEDVSDLLQIGTYIRTSGQTSANEKSSRSHAVFQILLKKADSNKLIGKFSLIDLAGNERGADTMSSSRSVRMEGAEINKSLLALKECIRALGRKGAHLPFRGSKLTLVLRDSFIGENSRTCMIALISPNICSCEHTLNTLRYADRVKELCPSLRNAPEILKSESEKFEDRNNKRYSSSEMNSKDMMNEKMFEVTDEINNLEEEIISNHKEFIMEHFPLWNRGHKQMYNSSRKVDYNIEKYTTSLEEMLNSQITAMKEMKEKVKNLMKYLQEEEELNKLFINKL